MSIAGVAKMRRCIPGLWRLKQTPVHRASLRQVATALRRTRLATWVRQHGTGAREGGVDACTLLSHAPPCGAMAAQNARAMWHGEEVRLEAASSPKTTLLQTRRVFVSLCETKTRVFGVAEHGIREADAGALWQCVMDCGCGGWHTDGAAGGLPCGT